MRRGQATVTSECSHTFHLRCIASSHYWATSVCPVCSARWRDCVSLAPPPQSAVFDDDDDDDDDDEPVEVEPPSLLDQVRPPTTNKQNGVVVLTTHCEHPAVARDTAIDKFAVLVHAKAPAATSASLDLVTVLDVSGSMAGTNLALLKQAMSFVIDRLGPGDRLSIVAFSSYVRRILRLTRMSNCGKAMAKAAVESLVAAHGGTDIGGGLRVAAEVLDGRRHRNAGAVASVILLSDGKDNRAAYHHPTNSICSISRYSGLAPQSLRRTFANTYPPPVHLFRLGTDDHDDGDAAAMNAIAEKTRGTLSSFIENDAAAAVVQVQDKLAQCIAGLRSVAVQEARVVVECLHPGVHVVAVNSSGGACYDDPRLIGNGGRAASVDVGELIAGEEKRFLLFLGVPPVAANDGGGDGDVTRLVRVSCSYKDAATGKSVEVCCEDDAAVQRPAVVVPLLLLPATATAAADVEVVARERFRVEAAEDICAARAAAGRGEHALAKHMLDRRLQVAAGLAGDDKCAELVAELRERSARVAADRREYERTGRASRVPLFGRTPAGSTFGATATGMSLVSFGGSMMAAAAAAPTPSFGS